MTSDAPNEIEYINMVISNTSEKMSDWLKSKVVSIVDAHSVFEGSCVIDRDQFGASHVEATVPSEEVIDVLYGLMLNIGDKLEISTDDLFVFYERLEPKIKSVYPTLFVEIYDDYRE